MLKLKIREREEVHAKKKWKPNATSIGFIDHAEHKGIIEENIDGEVEGPPNFEKTTLVQKKKLKKNGEYKSRGMINQTHDRLFGEAETRVLKSSCKMYILDVLFHNIPLDVNFDQDTNGDIRNLYDTLMSSSEDSQDPNLRNPYGECVNENFCTTDRKEYKVISKNTQSINEIATHNVESVGSRNFVIHANEDEDLFFASIIKRTIEKSTRSTYEKDHLVKVNENIDSVVYGSILLNNGVHDGFVQVLKDVDPSQNMQKRKYIKLITIERKTLREGLTIDKIGQVLENIKDGRQ
ncbi:unnamed protein product [Vicia faba]|uniref:Uncharacterized protein n=1 Tax=Vicia faba TaxID=3906 RepID=A0AAV0ZQ16_VICFA|nr:unnamed protein product [Vicia faba]